MQNIYRTHGRVSYDQTVMIEHVPFEAGATVEITVRAEHEERTGAARYPLRGMPVTLIDPIEPVAEQDWDVLR